MFRLLTGPVCQTDDREARHTVLEVRLNLDLPSLEPDERMRDGAPQHGTDGMGQKRMCLCRSRATSETSAVEPWRKLGEQVVYDRFRRIVSRSFALPDGRTAEFEVVELFDSAAVLALTSEQEVVLVREFRPGPEDVLLELPGGVVEREQAPIEAARAELLEETGYEGNLVEAGSLLKDAYATNTKHVFVATDCRPVAEPETPQFTEPLLMPLASFRSHLLAGRLTDVDAGYRPLDPLGLL